MGKGCDAWARGRLRTWVCASPVNRVTTDGWYLTSKCNALFRECRECKGLFMGGMRRSSVFCAARCSRRWWKRREGPSKHAARAKAKGSVGRHFNELRIFVRDGWRCKLCGVETPKRLRGSTAPNAPELDHIVSIAEGGPHIPENCQCTCRRCNGEKGATARGQLWLTGIADIRCNAL